MIIIKDTIIVNNAFHAENWCASPKHFKEIMIVQIPITTSIMAKIRNKIVKVMLLSISGVSLVKFSIPNKKNEGTQTNIRE